ncbi:hypothetical protein [Mesorhizobium caraganae]|uniref:hypothetical protein n=1 Tax=Mesorhizobium caraganae TaxID=483206 RepID=UPI003ED026A6
MACRPADIEHLAGLTVAEGKGAFWKQKSPTDQAGFWRVWRWAAVRLLNLYRHGEGYTEGQYRAWMTEAGLCDIRRSRLPDGYALFRGGLGGDFGLKDWFRKAMRGQPGSLANFSEHRRPLCA